MNIATRSTTTTLARLPLRHLAIRGSVWVSVGYGLTQLLRLGAHLILARLLFPEAFGLMALVTVFLTGLQMFSDVGIGPSIIQSRRGDERAFLNTAWSIQIIRGVVLTALGIAVAWPFAALYQEAQLGPLIAVASFAALIAGFNSTGLFAAKRHLAVGRVTMVELASQGLSVAVMITWAWLHPTVWALVGGGLVAAISKMLLSHLLWEGRDRPGWEWPAARALVSFGKWIFATSALSFLSTHGHRLMLGAYLMMAELGVYAVAFHLVDVIRATVSRITHSVMFPAFSRTFREQPERLGIVFYKARFVSDMLVLPTVGLLAALGPAVVNLLYDERYADAGWILQILSIRIALACIGLFGGACLLAAGNPRYAFVTNLIQSVWVFTGVPLVWGAFGFPGAVWVIATANLPSAFVVAWGLHRYQILVPWRELLAVCLFLLGVGLGLLIHPWLTPFTGGTA